MSQRAAWVLVPRPLNYRLSDALWTRVAPRNGGVSVSGVVVVYEASGTLGSSFVLRHHAWMLANAVSQGASSVGAGAAVAELPLERCCIDGRAAPNSSVPVSGPTGVLVTHGTLSRSLLVYHHDQMQANAVWQRAAWVLVPRSLIYSASNAYRWAAGAEIQRTCFGANWGACNAWDAKQELAGVSSRSDAGKCCVAESSVGAGAAAAELPLERCCIGARCAQKW